MGPIQEIKTEIGYEFPSGTVFKKREKGLELVFKNGKLTVLYSSPRDILRAALIAKANDDLKEYRVEEKNEFDDVCFMLDCSRNAVRNIATVKKLIRNLAMADDYNSPQKCPFSDVETTKNLGYDSRQYLLGILYSILPPLSILSKTFIPQWVKGENIHEKKGRPKDAFPLGRPCCFTSV